MKTSPRNLIVPTKCVAIAACLVLAPSLASAQVLYTEDFDADHSANWTVNSGPGGNAANFFFDYSTVGIPAAPHSGGSTLGLKLEANIGTPTSALGGVSVSPNGQSFTGDYTLRFDMWLNTVGPMPAGGSGSTQITGGGIGTSGTAAQYAGAANGLWFASTGDGGSSIDYRAYSPSATSGYTIASGFFAAPSLNGSDAYYASLGGQTPPAAQTALFPQQTGATGAGAPAFAWRDVVISKVGDTVSWSIDGLNLANVDVSAVTLGGNNIAFVQSDINGTSSTDPNARNLLFGLIDNVSVTVVPEPSTVGLLLLGGLALFAVRRRIA